MLRQDGAHPRQLRSAHRVDRPGPVEDLAARGGLKPGGDAHHRGLAGAVRSEDRREPGSREADVHVIEDGACTDLVADVMEFKQWEPRSAPRWERSRSRRRGAPTTAVRMPIGSSEGAMSELEPVRALQVLLLEDAGGLRERKPLSRPHGHEARNAIEGPGDGRAPGGAVAVSGNPVSRSGVAEAI